MMTPAAFAFLITGVLLNAAAQLLLKAGTNVMGVITLTPDNWTASCAHGKHPAVHRWRGPVRHQPARLDPGPVARAGIDRVSAAVIGLRYQCDRRDYLLGEAVTATRWAGIGFIIVGVWLVAPARRERRPISSSPGPSSTPRPSRTSSLSPALGPIDQRALGSALRGGLSTFCGGRPARVLTSATAAVEVALQLQVSGRATR